MGGAEYIGHGELRRKSKMKLSRRKNMKVLELEIHSGQKSHIFLRPNKIFRMIAARLAAKHKLQELTQ